MRLNLAQVPDRPVTRFAPSPTGFLHLGHVVNALFVWGIARARNGTVLLRIEDHDRQRSRPVFEAAILEDLAWLGLGWDGPAVRQSERGALYQAQVDRLGARHQVYACSCSRRELALTTPELPGQEMRYPGLCREKGLAWQSGYGLRVALAPGPVDFEDLLLGTQQQDPSRQSGDLQLKDRLGNWTYQFAVTVDDMLQGISLVIRGEDLLPSTGRQILLGEMLGRPRPARFLHHPLILKPGGKKLSKAERDSGIRDLRAQGESPSLVLGRAAHFSGLVERVREISPAEVSDLFSRG
jgi:glutamyl-Q tRNA(Asp) synthetase